MATLSFSSPGALLLDRVVNHFRAARAPEESPRPKPRRLPEPQSFRVPGVARDISVKIASEFAEWEEAFHLVTANYREAGYEQTTGKAFRFTPYHALPDTTVFVAKLAGRVVATFSLVTDNSVLGLPMESLYGAEIAELRRQGHRLAEVTSLAVADLGQREFVQVFHALIRLLQQYHVSRGGDSWVITVNPKHRAFYAKVLGFRPLGGCKAYAAVGDAPAEAYYLDRELMKANAPRAYEYVFGEALPSEVLAGSPLPRPIIRYFGTESSQTDETRLGDLLRSLATTCTSRAW